MAKRYIFPDEIIKSLSPLESYIVKSLNPTKSYSSQAVYNLLKKKKKVARSSIPVILDRLYNKGLLDRKSETARGGVKFIYIIKLNKEKYERGVVENTVNKLVKKFGEKAIVYFNKSVAKKRK